MIPIIDDWVLIADDKCYTIARYLGETPRKDGKTDKRLASVSYYTSLDSAFKGLRVQLERKTLQGAFPGLSEALRAVKNSNEILCEEFKRIADILEGENATD